MLPQSTPWIVKDRYVFLLLVSLACLMGNFSWHSTGTGSDGAIYLLLSEYFSPWTNTNNPALFDYLLPQAQFPPGYPMLLAILGLDVESLQWVHLLNSLLLMTGVWFFYKWASASVNSIAALGISLAFVFMPITFLLQLDIYSEFMFVALTMMALWVHHKQPDSLWLPVLIGLTIITRSIGFAFLAAWLISSFAHRIHIKPYKYLLAFMPVLAWSLYRGYSGTGSSYLTVLLVNTHNHGFSLILNTMSTQALSLTSAWHQLFNAGNDSLTALSGGAFVLALIGWLKRLAGLHLDGLYILFYLLIILVWPFPEFASRFLFPVLPIVMWYAVYGGKLSAQYVLKQSALSACMPARLAKNYTQIFLGMLLLTIASVQGAAVMKRFYHVTVDYRQPSLQHRVLYRDQGLTESVEEAKLRYNLTAALKNITSYVPESACIYSTITAQTMLYSRRAAILTPTEWINSQHNLCRFTLAIAWGSGNNGPWHPAHDLKKAGKHHLIYKSGQPGSAIALLFQRIDD